jgi:putative ABC transport system permease protein
MTVAEVLAERTACPGAAMDRLLADRLGLEDRGDTFRLGVQDFVLTALPGARARRDHLAIRLRPAHAGRDRGAGRLPASGARHAVRDLLPADAGRGRHARPAARRRPGRVRGRGDALARCPPWARRRWRISSTGSRPSWCWSGWPGWPWAASASRPRCAPIWRARPPVIATLKTLGAEGRTIFAVYFAQIGVLTALGVVAGLVLGAAGADPAGAGAGGAAAGARGLRLHPAAADRGGALRHADGAGLHALAAGAGRAGARRRALPRHRDRGAALAARRYLARAGAGAGGAGRIGDAGSLGAAQLALAAAAGIVGALAGLFLAALALRWLAPALAQARWLRGHTALRLALGASAARARG